MIALGMLVCGIIILIKGTVAVSSKKELRRPGSIIVGLIMVLPFPVSFGIGFLMGWDAAQNGKNLDDLQQDALLLDLAVVFGGALLAGLMALILAQPKRAKRRRDDQDDYEDEYDDRRRDRDDEDDYDRPRRRKVDRYTEDDDEQPRSRRRIDDDEQPRSRRRIDDDDEFDEYRRR